MKKPDTDDHSRAPAESTGRRAFLKGSAASVAAPLVITARRTEAQAGGAFPASPPTTPWVEELPAQIDPLQPSSALTPAPAYYAQSALGECGRADHERYAELCVNPAFYELRARENPSWVFNPAYPPQPVWGFAGNTQGASWDGNPASLATTAPGPTILARYGQPIVVRIYNELPQNHVGFGSPEISTHLHNAHNPSESDGFPGDFFSPLKSGPTLGGPGQWRDHFWPNVYAGVDEFGGIGDQREALGTLFYHDHTMDFTAPNVVKGMAGFYLLFDHIDSGNERDPRRSALRLPSHPYDYPLMFSDKRFDANGVLFYDQFDPEGVLGDKVVVNGKIEPVLRVARRKYRLRLLNGGPARFYRLSLADAAGILKPFIYIANDGNLLTAPLPGLTHVDIGPAERADIVFDFAPYPLGTELYIVNRRVQNSTRRYGGVSGAGTQVLKIIVDRDPPEEDLSQVPSRLRGMRPINQDEVANAPVRRFDFDRSKGQWTINGELFDLFRARATLRLGQAEVWEFISNNDGWVHPIHMHMEEGRLLSKRVKGRNVAIPAWERGRKDVFVVPEGPDTMLRVLVRFRDFTGKYPLHCHNLVHEDHAMMLRFDVTA